jgi:hypothetical protein
LDDEALGTFLSGFINGVNDEFGRGGVYNGVYFNDKDGRLLLTRDWRNQGKREKKQKKH